MIIEPLLSVIAHNYPLSTVKRISVRAQSWNYRHKCWLLVQLARKHTFLPYVIFSFSEIVREGTPRLLIAIKPVFIIVPVPFEFTSFYIANSFSDLLRYLTYLW